MWYPRSGVLSIPDLCCLSYFGKIIKDNEYIICLIFEGNYYKSNALGSQNQTFTIMILIQYNVCM